MEPERVVKSYLGSRRYQQATREMIAKGWHAANIVEDRPNRGCLALFPAQSNFVVTWERERPADAVPPGTCPNCGASRLMDAWFCPMCRAQVRE